MKFKSLLLQLKGCGIDKSMQEKQMILAILSKLGPKYAVFVSTFHIVRITLGEAWKIPSLDIFIESLMHEQDKLIKMGAIKSSKVHALVVHERNKSNPKSKQKGKGICILRKERKSIPNPLMNPPTPKVERESKGNMKCGYCNCGYHPKSSCMKKTIDLMVQAL
jgi:hypothetical protein